MPRRSRSPSRSPRSRSRGRASSRRARSPPRRARSSSRSRDRAPRERNGRDHARRRGAPSRSSSPAAAPRRPRREEGDAGSRVASAMEWGKKEDNEEDNGEPAVPVEKPNFGLSGALAKDKKTGNIQNGVVMKWSEPPEARVPQHRFRLYVFKNDELTATLHVHRKSGYLIGREKAIADILTEHESCSKQHAVLQYRLFQKPTKDGLDYTQEVRPYVMDLASTNGTFLNGKRIESARYIELKVKDVLKFGESTREYVLMDAS